MSDGPLYIAVDLGAGSGRVFLAAVEDDLLLEQVRRFTYPPRSVDGHLRWDARRIFDDIVAGLAQAAERARALGRPVASIGVDSWGVDYGLVDADGRLVEDPVCYRDATPEAMDQAFTLGPRAELFARTGVQILPFNTVFQLFAHVRRGVPDSAARLLLMPDLVNAFLSGIERTEFTNATTTQMLNAGTGQWDVPTVERLGLPARLLGPIVPAGTTLGPLRPEIARATGLQCAVVVPATHDTGSAVAGIPLQPGWAYISSGTWSLVGVERADILISEEIARDNFTNEGGAYGTVRFLKNVAGLWLLESCRREWLASGVACGYDDLLGAAAALPECPALVFPDDPRFLNPVSMIDALGHFMKETGQPRPTEPAVLTRAILDSLALRYAAVLGRVERLTGVGIEGIRIVGGGSQNAYLNQATATATGRRVVAGPVEATVIGNVMIQAVSAGRFDSLAAARRYVAGHVSVRDYEPMPTPAWGRQRQHYTALEAQAVAAGA